MSDAQYSKHNRSLALSASPKDPFWWAVERSYIVHPKYKI